MIPSSVCMYVRVYAYNTYTSIYIYIYIHSDVHTACTLPSHHAPGLAGACLTIGQEAHVVSVEGALHKVLHLAKHLLLCVCVCVCVYTHTQFIP